MNASEQAVLSAVKRTFPVTVRHADQTRRRGCEAAAGVRPRATCLVGTATEEGVVSPSADPGELCPKRSGLRVALLLTAEARNGDMERSHMHWAGQT